MTMEAYLVAAIAALAGAIVFQFKQSLKKANDCDKKYDALLRYVLASRDTTIHNSTITGQRMIAALEDLMKVFGKATVDAALNATEPLPHDLPTLHDSSEPSDDSTASIHLPQARQRPRTSER